LVAEGNCAIERWGGEQSEANNQPESKTRKNPIPSESLAGFWRKGEVGEVSHLEDPVALTINTTTPIAPILFNRVVVGTPVRVVN